MDIINYTYEMADSILYNIMYYNIHKYLLLNNNVNIMIYDDDIPDCKLDTNITINFCTEINKEDIPTNLTHDFIYFMKFISYNLKQFQNYIQIKYKKEIKNIEINYTDNQNNNHIINIDFDNIEYIFNIFYFKTQ